MKDNMARLNRKTLNDKSYHSGVNIFSGGKGYYRSMSDSSFFSLTLLTKDRLVDLQYLLDVLSQPNLTLCKTRLIYA